MWLLGGILALYAAVIGLGESALGGVARLLLLGYLGSLAVAGWPRGIRRRRLVLATLAALIGVASVLALVISSSSWRHAIVGGVSALSIVLVLASMGWSLADRGVVDRATVLAVLSGYLLLALGFASVHELCSAFLPHYLSGTDLDSTDDPPPVSTLLYFSVITLTTVGFGDVTPGTNLARAVAGLEALIGQLYLVSVVAATIGRSRGRRQ